MTIGDPKQEGSMNPNCANGNALEYFGSGSGVPVEMVTTCIEGAQGASCEV